MNIAIVGSRNFSNYEVFSNKLYYLFKSLKVDRIISGGAKGVDTMARTYANLHRIPLVEYLPEWDLYGKSAGFRRNVLIIDDSDLVIAFWDGSSKGTKSSIDLAKKQNKRVIIIGTKGWG